MATADPEETISPIKTKRVDEKTSLQGLNNRLEKYVLKMKEIEDAKVLAEGSIEQIRSTMEKELQAIKVRLGSEIDELRKELEHEMDQKTRLQVLEQEQYAELVKLRSRTKELEDAKIIADQLKVDLAREQESSRNAKETISTLSTKQQALQRQLKSLEKDAKKYSVLISNQEKELNDLREANSAMTSGRDQQIAQFRTDMNAKISSERVQLKTDYEQRLAKAEKEMRGHYDSIIKGHLAQISDLKGELQSIKSDHERVLVDYEDSLTVRQSLVDKVSCLEKDLRGEKKRFQEEKKSFDDQIENARQIRFQKDQEFNDLMDVKIALDAEIAAYESILDREDSRVHFMSPQLSAKRKSAQKKSTSSKKAKKHAYSAVRLQKLDLENDLVVLENVSSEDVQMKNWTVKSEQSNQTFAFPDGYVLKGNSTCSMVSGKSNKPKGSKSKSVFWSKKFMWNPKFDAAILVDPQGNEVGRVAEGMDESDDMIDDDELEAEELPINSGEGQCIVM